VEEGTASHHQDFVSANPQLTHIRNYVSQLDSTAVVGLSALSVEKSSGRRDVRRSLGRESLSWRPLLNLKFAGTSPISPSHNAASNAEEQKSKPSTAWRHNLPGNNHQVSHERFAGDDDCRYGEESAAAAEAVHPASLLTVELLFSNTFRLCDDEMSL
jgi:hypothetical protein